jgi:hypothetical protein
MAEASREALMIDNGHCLAGAHQQIDSSMNQLLTDP